ncbi:MAG: T9SS type A sorting domain-containing protein [Bacteroidia bacterium]
MNKRSIIYILICLFFAQCAISQSVKFEKVYGGSGYDYGYSVTQAYDKGYVIAGATTSFGNGTTDAYMLKVDSLGAIKWQRTFGGINLEQSYSIKETADTNYIIAGFTNSFGFGGYDMYLIKTNRGGDTLWTKTYGGTNWDFAYCAEPTSDGGYIMAGGTYSFGKGDEDMYVVKLNANGDTLWTKTYGGTEQDEAKSIIQTSDGGYLLTGFSKSLGEPNGDIYTIKTNSMGDTLWTKKFGGVEVDEAYDVLENTLTNEYLVAGRSKSVGAGNFDGVIIKYSTTGTEIYVPTYGGTDDDGIQSIDVSANGRLASAGYTYTFGFGLGTSEFLLYVENPFNGFHSGTFGGNKMEKAYCVSSTKDNGYIMVGTSTSYSNLEHIYLVKLDSNGVSSANVSNVITTINSFNEVESSAFLYPNPASNELNINLASFPKNKKYSLTIADVLGREYISTSIETSSATNHTINTSQLPKGVYFVKIQGDNFSFSQRVVVQR